MEDRLKERHFLSFILLSSKAKSLKSSWCCIVCDSLGEKKKQNGHFSGVQNVRNACVWLDALKSITHSNYVKEICYIQNAQSM